MITIKFFVDAIKVQGHANADEYGKDIYCAGVSAIVMGALNWFNDKDVKYEFDDGHYELKIINQSKSNLQKLELIKIQLRSLDHTEYKQYIKIIEQK